jgi:hypothetical protein
LELSPPALTDDYCLSMLCCQFSALVERLGRVIHPTYIPMWLSEPNPALDDDKPIDRIVQGDYRSVVRLISGLEDTGAS